ncbi:hypothetical protein BDF21DRAFT_414200 [Thamnidium elegans]|nr:hypothetical protein BDF21DRAFT_414200 [Thamnidium elegans]
MRSRSTTKFTSQQLDYFAIFIGSVNLARFDIWYKVIVSFDTHDQICRYCVIVAQKAF